MAAPKVVRLEKVTKRYVLGDQELFALNEISLDIHQGEFVAIIGPSGSGKSTLMHVASLLDTASDGKVFIKDKEVSSYSESERAKLRNQAIGFIFQQFNLLSKTSALENVSLPLLYANVSLSERNRRAKEMLVRVGLGDRLNNSPNQLSGGQQQRVAIARALINDPTVIFADEPTGNLDTRSGGEIRQMLLDLHSEGRTIVMVTHDMKMADLASRVVTLEDGKVLTDEKGKRHR